MGGRVREAVICFSYARSQCSLVSACGSSVLRGAVALLPVQVGCYRKRQPSRGSLEFDEVAGVAGIAEFAVFAEVVGLADNRGLLHPSPGPPFPFHPFPSQFEDILSLSSSLASSSSSRRPGSGSRMHQSSCKAGSKCKGCGSPFCSGRHRSAGGLGDR